MTKYSILNCVFVQFKYIVKLASIIMKENLFQKRVVLKQMNKKPQKTILKGKLLQQIVE